MASIAACAAPFARVASSLAGLPKTTLLACSVVALAGCDRNDVQVYKVAKEAAPAAKSAPREHGQPQSTGRGALPTLTWKVPAGWEEAAPGEMRVASFRVKGNGSEQADVGVFPLPGMSSSDADNVNRWRGQVGQPAVSAEELEKSAEAVPIDGMTAKLYETAGENPGSGDKTRILGAILWRQNVPWYFKMTGSDELVAKQRPAFVEFLKSLKFSETKSELPPDHPPIDMTGGAGTAPAVAGGGQAKPKWEVPQGWQEAPAGQFLLAKFGVPGADITKASVNVSMSTGEGGGLVGNVNRWRRQLGLSESTADEIQKSVKTLDTQGGKASLVELSGMDARTGEKARLIGAIVPRQGQTWFYKLMGPEAIVEQQREPFVSFIRSATYPNAS